MSEIKYVMSIIRGKLKNADEHNLHYQRFSIADMEAILGVLSKSESDYAALQQKLDAIAAEADYLRNAIREHSESTHFCEVCGKDDPCETDDVCWALKHELPATDAYLNSVRAEAVEAFTADIVLKMRESGAGAYDYADIVEAQGQELVLILRSGTHDTADKAG